MKTVLFVTSKGRLKAWRYELPLASGYERACTERGCELIAYRDLWEGAHIIERLISMEGMDCELCYSVGSNCWLESNPSASFYRMRMLVTEH